MTLPTGNIFLSHASQDKSYVEKVYERLDAAGTFYDIKSITAGAAFLDAMKKGVQDTSVFVLFHSPNTKDSWVEFETKLAEVQAASRNDFRILVCPIGGETYSSLPDWMKAHMTTTEDYTVSDTVRAILHQQKSITTPQTRQNRSVVGREGILNEIQLAILTAVPVSGQPLQHIVLSGLMGMGRSTVGKLVIDRFFSKMRPSGPVFDLPDMAESIDFYLALKEDLDGVMSKNEVERQIAAFELLTPIEQAKTIAGQFFHWAKLNQPVVIKTRWGLRDRGRHLKPWLDEFFKITAGSTNLRVIFISERRLPDEQVAERANIAQFLIGELSPTDMQILLNQLIDPRYYDARKAEALTALIGGHPATASYAALLINKGRNADTLEANPGPIVAFQQKALEAVFRDDLLNDIQAQILALLGIFPKLSFRMFAQVLELQKKELAEEIWQLSEFSLISTVDSEFFSSPDIVATYSRRNLSTLSTPLLADVKEKIEADIANGEMDSQLVSALLIATIEASGDVPHELVGLLTSSNLLSIVRSKFDRANSNRGNYRDEFATIYKIAKLAMNMKVSDDSVEQILFTGGDSAVRAGILPDDIISFMESNALPAVYYLRGSYAFHVERNMEAAIKNLRQALALKHFRLRNVRLLVRAYMRNQQFKDAYDVIEGLPESQVQRETGLLLLKIRALRGMRQFGEADKLEASLNTSRDDFGEIPLYRAAKSLREMKLPEAKRQIELAKKAARVNHFSCQLLECAVLLESGDASLLPATVEIANAINRPADAWQMRARHAVVEGKWADAEEYLSKIDRKDYFDLQIEKRCIDLKKEDIIISRDVAELAECEKRLEEIARLSANSPEGFRQA